MEEHDEGKKGEGDDRKSDDNAVRDHDWVNSTTNWTDIAIRRASG